MPCPRYDFHTHTAYLGCANETMEVAAIVRECERLDVKALGITDHLNHLNQMELHAPILADIRALDTPVAVYFGVELNYTACDGPFAFNEEVKEACGFQFAIGGIHATYVDEYDPRKIIDIQHRHHLKTCADPLVQVLVHPYWFSEGEFKQRGWPLDEWIGWIPESHARELAQAARDSGTAIEINATANLTN
ncbi:MAG: PHP domain-containing protein, partial [Nitrospiraceae bacterium]|nr:PHP domain-containing protein [Nitrospiraceae bacterium]